MCVEVFTHQLIKMKMVVVDFAKRFSNQVE